MTSSKRQHPSHLTPGLPDNIFGRCPDNLEPRAPREVKEERLRLVQRGLCPDCRRPMLAVVVDLRGALLRCWRQHYEYLYPTKSRVAQMAKAGLIERFARKELA